VPQRLLRSRRGNGAHRDSGQSVSLPSAAAAVGKTVENGRLKKLQSIRQPTGRRSASTPPPNRYHCCATTLQLRSSLGSAARCTTRGGLGHAATVADDMNATWGAAVLASAPDASGNTHVYIPTQVLACLVVRVCWSGNYSETHTPS